MSNSKVTSFSIIKFSLNDLKILELSYFSLFS